MKKLVFILIMNLLSGITIAQYGQYHEETNFETNLQLVRIDNSNPENTWQIGPPQKAFFNGAYSVPNAIVTDTINLYPQSNYSSFYISIKDLNWFTGSPSILSFVHKYDTDSLSDGGYIDASYDGGETWLNIIYDSTMFNCSWTPGFGYFSYNFYGDTNTLYNGVNGFSGKSDEWQESMFVWYYCIGVDEEYPDSMMIRFNFISDDQPNDKEGWMIDNIVLNSDICGYIPEGMANHYSATIQPNPINDESKLIISGAIGQKYYLTITDIFGRLVYSVSAKDKEFQMNLAELENGLYFYRIKFEDNYKLSGKFVKN